eukprot:TRINITY_DN30291_c0_g1_i1.p1 TRINITY_DN30291_c0_g1~~TRINITY_DN30291_c0_g1_i1.p1  ORF type:complete len:422 (+),score=59.03 TRINITY_DN30291_c0_g1_i1:63-1328(+)
MTSSSKLSDLHPIEPASSTRRANVRWLGVLFLMSSFVFCLQLGLGYWGNSLALLADAGHSGTDVITYGLNCIVELWKVAASSSGVSQNVTNDRNFAIIDMVGCLLTTLLLCVSTWLASTEAIVRLQTDGSPEDGDFGSIGVALFTFAVLSLAANVFTLAVYRTCRAKADVAASSKVKGAHVTSALRSPQPSSIPSKVIIGSAPSQELDSFSMSTTSRLSDGVADIEPPPVPVLAHREAREQRRRDNGDVRGSSLNLSAAFHNASASACADEACTDAACLVGKHESPLEPSVEVAQDRPFAWTDALHSMVHPGCNCGAHEDGSPDGTGTVNSKVGKANLNVLSAMLHLIADVVRSLTILVVAIFIQARVLGDGRMADAVCALIVAAFVLVGSCELVRRMCAAASVLRDTIVNASYVQQEDKV